MTLVTMGVVAESSVIDSASFAFLIAEVKLLVVSAVLSAAVFVAPTVSRVVPPGLGVSPV